MEDQTKKKLKVTQGFNILGIPKVNATAQELIFNSQAYQFGNKIDVKLTKALGGANNLLDARLRVLKMDIFKDKRILDIGCGSGGICLDLFNHSRAKFIKGIDLDHKLIKIAIKKLELSKKSLSDEGKASKVQNSENQMMKKLGETKLDMAMMPASFKSLLNKMNVNLNE